MRAKGLIILGRKKMFMPDEWTPSYSKRISTPGYIAWSNRECRELGERFGLASWVVTMYCLVKGYNPENDRLAIGSGYPQIRVVTDNTDQMFITKLTYEAQKLGLLVIYRQASSETVLILPGTITDVPAPAEKPSLYSTFQMRVEVPVGYPHDAARKLQSQATQLQRELLLRLGYTVPKRLRTSSLASIASDLKVEVNHLPSGAVYKIIDKLYGEDDLSHDKPRRNAVKVKRLRLKNRLQNLRNNR